MALLKRVLLTNDDGIDAPGLAVAAEVAAKLAEEVWIAAPAGDCSGMSRQVSLHAPLRVEARAPRSIAVSGSPADAVIVGLRHLMRDTPPDLVLSGINAGANHAKEVGFSGTVGAALTARLLGVPALALSQDWLKRDEVPWDTSRHWLPKVIHRLWHHGPLPQAGVYNINVPRGPAEEVTGVALTRLGTALKLDIDVDQRTDNREKHYYWLRFERERVAEEFETDAAALDRNAVSVTPVAIDQTDHTLFGELMSTLDLESF